MLHEKAEIRAIYYALVGYNLKAFYRAGSYSTPFTQPHVLVSDLINARILPESARLAKRVALQGSHTFWRYTCKELDADTLCRNQDKIHDICLNRGWDYGQVMTALAMLCGHGLLTGVTRCLIPELAPVLNLIRHGSRHLRGSIIGDLDMFTKAATCTLLPNR